MCDLHTGPEHGRRVEKSQVDLPILTTCQTHLGGLPRAKVSSQVGPSAQSSSYPRVVTFHGAACNFQPNLFCKCLLWVVTHSPVLSEAARIQKSWARIRREEERIEQNRSDKFTSLTCPSVALVWFLLDSSLLYSNISCTRIQILLQSLYKFFKIFLWKYS